MTLLMQSNRRLMIEDPTRQAGNRRRAASELRRRLAEAHKDVKQLVDSIPVSLSVRNSLSLNRETYIWEMSPERQQQVDQRIRDIINGWFETQTPERPARWFFTRYMADATQPATADAVNNVKLLARGIVNTATLDMVTVQAIFFEPQYRNVIENIYGRAFNEMAGFAGEESTNLARILSDSVMLGESPRRAQAKIAQEFETSISRAERISRTEINRAYTVARTKAADEAAKKLDIQVRVVHRSSLMPSTRTWHAKRHGKVYTIQEQNDWWDEGTNRINCLCSVSEVVIDDEGNVRARGLIEKLEKQRESWVKG